MPHAPQRTLARPRSRFSSQVTAPLALQKGHSNRLGSVVRARLAAAAACAIAWLPLLLRLPIAKNVAGTDPWDPRLVEPVAVSNSVGTSGRACLWGKQMLLSEPRPRLYESDELTGDESKPVRYAVLARGWRA